MNKEKLVTIAEDEFIKMCKVLVAIHFLANTDSQCQEESTVKQNILKILYDYDLLPMSVEMAEQFSKQFLKGH